MCDRCSTQSDAIPWRLSLSFFNIFGEINETREFFFLLFDAKRTRRKGRDEKPTIVINMCVCVKEQINIYD